MLRRFYCWLSKFTQRDECAFSQNKMLKVSSFLEQIILFTVPYRRFCSSRIYCSDKELVSKVIGFEGTCLRQL